MSLRPVARWQGIDGAMPPLELGGEDIVARALRDRVALMDNQHRPTRTGSRRDAPGGAGRGPSPNRRLMLAPVARDERLHALVVVADRDSDYDLLELRFVMAMADLLWDLRQRRRLQHLTVYDAVTGLTNRATLLRRLALATAGAEPATLAYIDVDHFASINDSVGQAGGDQVLRTLAERWRAALRPDVIFGRIGADEFALLLPIPADTPALLETMTRLREVAAQPIGIAGQEVRASISVGLARLPEDATDAERLLAAAEAACRAERRGGGSGVGLFDPEASRRARRWFETENALRDALERDELRLLYQPQVELSTGLVVGCEALLRWQRGDALLPPGAFLDVVEGSELFLPVGRWVLDAACRQARVWHDRDHPLPVAVNVFPAQISGDTLLDDVRRTLSRHRLPAHLLELEVIETSLVRDPEQAARTLSGLRRMGVRLALDDFGTGWCSLSYLKHFPFDVIKIDQVFTRNITRDPTDLSIVRSTVDLAHQLGKRVLAEGIEEPSHLQYLEQYGCDQGQGYLFSRPMPAAQVEAMIMERRDLRPAQVIARGGTGAVLLLGKDPEQQELLALVLGNHGWSVRLAADTASASARLEAERIDLLLLDLGPGDQEALAFLARVRRLFPFTRRIAIGDRDDGATLIDALNRGGLHAYLPRPWQPRPLLGLIREAMGGPLSLEAGDG